MPCTDLHNMLAMKANNNQGRREWEGKKEHFAREYDKPKFNSALVEQGASVLNVFEACMCVRASLFKFVFTGVYKVLWNTDFSQLAKV